MFARKPRRVPDVLRLTPLARLRLNFYDRSMAPVRVGSLSPARLQKIIANVRAGQAAFNQLKANLTREEQLVKNIEKLSRETIKVMRLQSARTIAHHEGSNANWRNNMINARLQRNIDRRNQDIQRLEANLVALRRRLLGRPSVLSNRNILTGLNYGVVRDQINRLQMKRLARLITTAYLNSGGIYSRKLVNNVKRVALSK